MRHQPSFLLSALLLVLLITPGFAASPETADSYSNRVLSEYGKAWSVDALRKFVPPQMSQQQLVGLSSPLQKHLGPLVRVISKKETGHHNIAGITGLTRVTDYQAELQCQKSKATAKLSVASHNGQWGLMFVDIDGPAMHGTEATAVENSAKSWSISVLPSILENWRVERLTEIGDPAFTKQLTANSMKMKAMFATMSTMLGKPKKYGQPRITGEGPFTDGRTMIGVDVQTEFERGTAIVETIGVQTGKDWRLVGFHIRSAKPKAQ